MGLWAHECGTCHDDHELMDAKNPHRISETGLARKKWEKMQGIRLVVTRIQGIREYITGISMHRNQDKSL